MFLQDVFFVLFCVKPEDDKLHSAPGLIIAAMDIIYIDSLFLLNLLIDYLLCLVSARVCGLRLKRLRYALAALVGALYAVGVYLPGLEFLRLPAMKLFLWLIMALCAFGGEAEILRCGVVFAAVSAAFGGFIWGIELAGGRPVFDVRTLILSFALCYAAMRLVFGARAKLADDKRMLVRMELEGKKAEFTALHDTGNRLSEPISGSRVIIVAPCAARPLFEGCEELLELEGVAFMEMASALPRFEGRLRLIPYSSLGGSGLLCAFRPDSVLCDGEKLEIMAALSHAAAGDGFQAIL